MDLTNNDIHNLLVFLNRVQLSGSEAVTFVQLLEKLMKMQKGDDSNGYAPDHAKPSV